MSLGTVVIFSTSSISIKWRVHYRDGKWEWDPMRFVSRAKILGTSTPVLCPSLVHFMFTDTSLSWPQKAGRIFARLFSNNINKNQVVLNFLMLEIDIVNNLLAKNKIKIQNKISISSWVWKFVKRKMFNICYNITYYVKRAKTYFLFIAVQTHLSNDLIPEKITYSCPSWNLFCIVN